MGAQRFVMHAERDMELYTSRSNSANNSRATLTLRGNDIALEWSKYTLKLKHKPDAERIPDWDQPEDQTPAQYADLIFADDINIGMIKLREMRT